MNKPNVEDYLKKGIYGEKEIKPEEKRMYLGTFRERVVIALKQNQVREPQVYSEIEKQMSEHPNAHLFLNGNMNYSYLSKYIEIANDRNIAFTLVTNKEYNSEIGLVLAVDFAIEKEEIFPEKIEVKKKEKEENHKESKGFLSFFKGFGKKGR